MVTSSESARVRLARRGGTTLLLAAALSALVLALHGRVVTFGVMEYDDFEQLFANDLFNPPSWTGLSTALREPFFGLYTPLPRVAWMIAAAASWSAERATGALPPWLFHGLNLLVHAINCALVFALVRRLLRAVSTMEERGAVVPVERGRDAAAALGAAIFALHPCQVEPVAWISSLNVPLFSLFGLSFLLVAIGERPTQVPTGRRRIALAALLLALALLSKPTATVLPAIAIALEVLVCRLTLREAAARHALFVAMVVPVLLLTPSLQSHPPGVYGAAERMMVAGDSLGFYSRKVIVPLATAIDYGRTPAFVLAHGGAWWGAVPLVATALALRFRRSQPLVAAGCLVFLLALVPATGIVPFNFQVFSTVSDRSMYLALLGPAMMAASLYERFASAAWAPVVASVVVVSLAVASWGEETYWRKTVPLLTRALEVNPQSRLAAANLGIALQKRGQLAEAAGYLQRAAELDPGRGTNWLNLGKALMGTSRPREGLEAFQRAADLLPDDADAHASLALAFEVAGQSDSARREMQTAIRLAPADPELKGHLERIEAGQRP